MRRLRAVAWLLLFALGAWADERDDRAQAFVHFRLDGVVGEATSGAGPFGDDAHGAGHPSAADVAAGQRAINEFLRGRPADAPLTIADALKVYALAGKGGPRAVHGLIGKPVGEGIPESMSKSLGQLRAQFQVEALEELARVVKRKTPLTAIGVNDFGATSDLNKVHAATDIDFTLYPKLELEGFSPRQLVEEFERVFTDLAKRKYGVDLRPAQADIVAHRSDATIPDFRQGHGLAEFELRLRRGRSLLRANSEAYFLEGAYVQQVMHRSAAGQQTFAWLEPSEDGSVQRTLLNAVAVPLYFYKPEVKPRHAFGGAVGNLHFFRAHAGDLKLEAKYLLRSVDEGAGLLVPGRSKELAAMSPQERRHFLNKLYDPSRGVGLGPDERTLVLLAMETATRVRQAHARKEVLPDAQAFAPFVEELRRRGAQAPEGVLLERGKVLFARASQLALVTNVLLSAEPRFRDWYAPDRAERLTVYVDEQGGAREVRPTATQLQKLQYAAFFEIHDALELLPPKERTALKQKLGEANPRLAADIEVVERLITKEREMMLPGDEDPLAALDHRGQAARGVLDAWDAFAKSPGGSRWRGTWETAQRSWQLGSALESYLHSRMTDAVCASAGQQYGAQLEALRQATAATNDALLSPRWMSRMSRANALVAVLTVYVREGGVTPEVQRTAVIQGLGLLPLIGMAVDLRYTGVGRTVGQVVLVQVVPGYGQVMVVLSTAKGAVELGGTLLFEPLVDDRVLLAYQGYLPAGRLKAERVQSPRPALLGPIDPVNESLASRREKVHGYFFPRVKTIFERRYGEGADVRELSKTFAAVEAERLPPMLTAFVDDWWNGTGPFASEDTLAVRRMMDEFYGERMRQELVQRLLRDYFDGKRQLLMKEQQLHEANEQLLKRLARMDELMRLEAQKDASEARAAHGAVGEQALGELQEEVPVIEPRLELASAPRVRTARREDGRGVDVVEDLRLSAKLMASPTPQHPGPFTVRWRVAGGPANEQLLVGQSFKKEDDPSRVPASVRVTAEALDANGAVLVAASLDVPLEKGPPLAGEDVCGQPATLADARHCVEQAVREADALAEQVEKWCAEAKQHLVRATQSADTVRAGLDTLRARVAEAEARVTRLQALLPRVVGTHREVERCEEALGTLAADVERARSTLCAVPPPLDLAAPRGRLDGLLEAASAQQLRAGNAELEARQALRELEELVRGVQALEQVPDVGVDQRALVDQLSEAEQDATRARDLLGGLAALVTRVKANVDAGLGFLRTRGGPAGEERTFVETRARLEALQARLQACPDVVSRDVASLTRDADALAADLGWLDVRRQRVREGLREADEVRRNGDEALEHAQAAVQRFSALRASAQLAVDCGAGAQRIPPSDAEVAEALARADCRRLPGSVAAFDARARRVTCVCPAGLALDQAGARCLDCAAAEQAMRAAWQRSDVEGVRRVLLEAGRCPFAEPARQLLAQQLDLACLRGETAVYQDLNGGRLESAVQKLQRLQQAGCRLNPQTVADVRAAVDLRRRQRDLQRQQQELAMWNQLFSTMTELQRQQQQPPPPVRQPPPLSQPAPSRPTSPTTPPVTPPVTPPRGPQPPAGASRTDCEKKFCPVCGNDDVMLMGQSTDPQCTSCQQRFAQQIKDCMAGGRSASAPDSTVSQFRDHFVMRCTQLIGGRQQVSFRVKGPDAPALPGNETCVVQGTACTYVECTFQAQRLNAAR